MTVMDEKWGVYSQRPAAANKSVSGHAVQK